MGSKTPGNDHEQGSEPIHHHVTGKRVWHTNDNVGLYIPLVPDYRYVRRLDGNLEETYRILFSSALTALDVRRIGGLLANLPEQQDPARGLLALLKLDFTLEATCECRYLCTEENWKARVGVFHAAWEQIDDVHSIHAIDLTPWWRMLES